MSMESFPPEMHAAMRSPGAMRSYCLTAVMNGVQSPLVIGLLDAALDLLIGFELSAHVDRSRS